MSPKQLDTAFFARHPVEVAREVLGSIVFFNDAGGRIVETEAYHHTEPAAHSFRGPTPRTRPMFGPPGRSYVYRSYGLHWCLNFVCETGSAVLIRALEPVAGLADMAERRGTDNPLLLCSGPGRLCAALGIGGEHSGLPLQEPPFAVRAGDEVGEIVAGPRIGITKATELAWRFGLSGSQFLSRRFST